MAAFGDALVIRILGDSSGLQGELDAVAARFDALQNQVEEFQQSQSQLGRLGTTIAAAVAPLQNLGRAFEQVVRQADDLAHVSITLNVGPALTALSNLSAAIAGVAAQLQALSAPVGLPTAVPLPIPTPFAAGDASPAPIRQFAEGGEVSGPVGVDRVPAWLSAGEFVLQASAVERLGVSFLQQLNQEPRSWRTPPPAREPPPAATAVSNSFGDIVIQVSQPTDLDAVLQALAREQVHVRNRRG